MHNTEQTWNMFYMSFYHVAFGRFLWETLTYLADDIHSRWPHELKYDAAVSIHPECYFWLPIHMFMEKLNPKKGPYLFLQYLQSCFHFLHCSLNIFFNLKNKEMATFCIFSFSSHAAPKIEPQQKLNKRSYMWRTGTYEICGHKQQHKLPVFHLKGHAV